MRKIAILFTLAIMLWGCEKTNNEIVEQKTAARSAFPTSINLGNDTIVFKVDTVVLSNATAHLALCGTAPNTEAPIMGTEVYQISGPSTTHIVGQSPQVKIYSLIYGTYKFVGHAYIIGYRSCDNTVMNDNAYDTITITKVRNRKIK